MSMSGKFNSVITAIETMAARDDTISAEFVKNRFLDKEMKLKKGQALSHGRNVTFLTCFNCGKQGHIKRNCRYKQGNDNRRHGNLEPSEYNERRATGRQSPGTARNEQSRQRDKYHTRQYDKENSSGKARTAEATREEDVTFCSQTDTAYGNADNNGINFILDSDASYHMIKKELFDLTHNQRKLKKSIEVTVVKADQVIAR